MTSRSEYFLQFSVRTIASISFEAPSGLSQEEMVTYIIEKDLLYKADLEPLSLGDDLRRAVKEGFLSDEICPLD